MHGRIEWGITKGEFRGAKTLERSGGLIPLNYLPHRLCNIQVPTGSLNGLMPVAPIFK